MCSVPAIGCEPINIYGLFCFNTNSFRLQTSVTIVLGVTIHSSASKISGVLFIGEQTKIMSQSFNVVISSETFGFIFFTFLIVSLFLVTTLIFKLASVSFLNKEPPIRPNEIIPTVFVCIL